MHTQNQRPERVRGEHTPTKEKPLSETQQGQSKKHKRIVPLSLMNKAQSAHFYEIHLIETKDGPRIDSRLLAQRMGNTHRPTVALIDKYRQQLEHLGQVLFKKADGERYQGGGKAERVCLLNEDQALFVLALSRNSARVVELKLKLVQAFGAARRDAQQRQTEYLPEYHQLHDQIKTLAAGSEHERFVHMNINRLVNKTAGIEAGQRTHIPISMLATVQHLALVAMSGATDHHEGYQKAKAALGTFQTLLVVSNEGGHHGL